MERKQELKPTPLDQLAKMNQEVVALPGWTDDVPFYARLRKLSLYDLIQAGKIPNELLEIANEFALPRQGHNPVAKLDKEGKLDGDGIKKFHQFLDHVARLALIEPTYDQVVEHAGCITQEQKQAILLYAIAGVRVLESFRSQPRPSNAGGGDSENVGSQTE